MTTRVKIKKTMFRNGPRVEKLLEILLQRRENINKTPKKMDRNFGKSKSISRAAIIDGKEEKRIKTRKQAIAASPNLKRKKAVVIDRKTIIFIDANQDPIKAKENYLKNRVS